MTGSAGTGSSGSSNPWYADIDWEELGRAALGAYSSKKSSDAGKRAGKQAAKGNQAEIDFIEKYMNLARQDQAPYRQAGYTALNALMSLVGLGGPQTGPTDAPTTTPNAPSTAGINVGGAAAGYPNLAQGMVSGSGGLAGAAQDYNIPIVNISRYGGGGMSGDNYNINELGPEDVYSGGAITRHKQPATITGQDGYVHPTQSRYGGGSVFDNARIPPNKRTLGGPTTPNAPPIVGDPQAPANTTAVDPNTGFPNENPGGVEGGFQFQTEPGYQFRFEEGMRALDRGAAARGGLLSGGYGRKAIRYGQGFASNEYTNVYNRIANIAGMGQTANSQSGNYALQAGFGMGNAAANQGYANAYGTQLQSNARQSGFENLGAVDWASIFNRGD